jgi:heterodisulfide reductase subunit A2
VGNIILATGFDLFDAGGSRNMDTAGLANVFTSMEFERICNAAGPTNGELVLRDGVTKPESVASCIVLAAGITTITITVPASAACRA